MKTYTYTEARQQLAGLLDEASRHGEVRIRRRDGRLFALQPVRSEASPLDIPPVTTDVTLPEILGFIREGREAGLYDPRVQPKGSKSAPKRGVPKRKRRP
jgi:hypothetical protein